LISHTDLIIKDGDNCHPKGRRLAGVIWLQTTDQNLNIGGIFYARFPCYQGYQNIFLLFFDLLRQEKSRTSDGPARDYPHKLSASRILLVVMVVAVMMMFAATGSLRCLCLRNE
jgi:hypothetical protein